MISKEIQNLMWVIHYLYYLQVYVSNYWQIYQAPFSSIGTAEYNKKSKICKNCYSIWIMTTRHGK